MKAAVVWEAAKPMTIEDVTIFKPKNREVIVNTAYAGICHSDLHLQDGTFPHPMPFIPGHECSGIVEAVGEDVTYVKPGDHVVGCLSTFCGTCAQCVTGHPNLCESTDIKLPWGVARRYSLNGENVHQSSSLSAFAEQMLVHENSLVKIDKEVPLDRAALVGCGVLTGVGAVIHAAKVTTGASVAVIGCGGVGLSVISGARIAGAGRIIAIDRLDSKLQIAKDLGATDVINAADKDAVAEVVEMTKGGVEYSFEALGLPQTAQNAFDMLRMGGTATILGMFKPGTKLQLEASFFMKDRKIQGSSMGSNRFRVDIPHLLDFYKQGRLDLDHLISDRIELSQINEGYEKLYGGAPVRQIIDFHL